MNNLLILGKYLDQPRLVGKFSKAVPSLLVAGGAAFTIHNVHTSPKEQKRNALIKNISVLAGTIGSALLATRGLRPIKLGEKLLFKGFDGLSEREDLDGLTKINITLVDSFLEKHKVSVSAADNLRRSKAKILSFSQVKSLFSELYVNKNGKELLDNLIPNPENVDSKHIFSEIKRLSLMGLVPVVGGVLGGIVGDKITDKNWKDKIPDKIKEGSYQYLANIFLCNVGAGAALALLEKMKIGSKSARAAGMIFGIIAVGVVGGSAIANLIGKIIIDPCLRMNKQKNIDENFIKVKDCKSHSLYSERKPEALDVGLHVDDIATVAVLSGLKWIEPALPVLYSISGYRAGIGYRN